MKKKINGYGLIKINDWDLSSNIIDRNYYIFAVKRDYSDFEITDTEENKVYKIDSISNMNIIHRLIYHNNKEEINPKIQNSVKFSDSLKRNVYESEEKANISVVLSTNCNNGNQQQGDDLSR